jgi:hypothetical protein
VWTARAKVAATDSESMRVRETYNNLEKIELTHKLEVQREEHVRWLRLCDTARVREEVARTSIA